MSVDVEVIGADEVVAVATEAAVEVVVALAVVVVYNVVVEEMLSVLGMYASQRAVTSLDSPHSISSKELYVNFTQFCHN